MSLQSWGMYPEIDNTVLKCDRVATLRKTVSSYPELIPHGNGRSYGDSALNKYIAHLRPRDYFLDFDETHGLLHVQAGVLLSEILEFFVPRGWFLNVTPGTKYITVGGAIASDVHGKNHHIDGCFSEHLMSFRIMLADGEIVTCDRINTPDLWRATCGGMGLTGIILDAKLHLTRINSRYLDQTTIKTKNLKETFEAFEANKDKPYSVAWIDCLAKSNKLGRSLLMTGEFRNDGKLDYLHKNSGSVPFNCPSFLLNNYTVRAFNWLYYSRKRDTISTQRVDLDTFFYPLDSISHWNRIYGKSGFTQYQFILPKDSSYEGLKEILELISKSGKGSFLAVLKLYGKSNENWLSFPMEGYGLALDFKIENSIFELLNRLDNIIVKHNGRIYLAKDARVSKETFEKGYPEINRFRHYRRENNMDKKFHSLQSKRLGI